MNTRKNFLTNPYFLSCLVVLGFTMVAYIAGGIYPFGGKTVATYDMYWQHCTFLNFLFDIIEGKGTLNFSNFVAGGANITGFWLNLLLTPIYLIVLLFGRDNIYVSINFLFPVYLILIALSICYYLQKKHTDLRLSFKIMLTAIYVFSGYMLFNYTSLVWLNFLIIMPLLTLGFEKLVKDNKITLFTSCTIAMIFSSFNLGCSAQIILLCVYFAYIYFCVEKEKQKKVVFNLIIALFIALLVSMIVIVPSFILYTESSRSVSFFDYVIKGNNISASTAKFIYLISNLFCVILSVFYLIISNKKDCKNKFLIVMFILLNIPVVFDTSLKLLCFGSYKGYAERLFFINSFAIIEMSAMIIRKYQEKKLYSKDLVETKKSKALLISLIAVAVVCWAVVLILNYPNLCNLLSNAQANGENFSQYFSIIAFLLVIYIISILFAEFKKINLNTLRVIIILTLCLEVLTNSLLFIAPKKYDIYSNKLYESVIQNLEKDSNVKYYDSSTFVYNYQLFGDVKSISGFSSLLGEENEMTYRHLGYVTSNGAITTESGTAFSDCLNSFNYVISSKKLSYKHLSLVENRLGYYIYKNIWAFPQIIKMRQNYAFDDSLNLYENLNIFANSLGLSGELFTITKGLNASNIRVEQNNTKLSIKDGIYEISNKEESSVTISYTAQNDGIFYINYNLFDFKRQITSERKLPYYNEYKTYGDISLNSGEVGHFDLDYCGEYKLKNITIGFLNYDKLEELYNIVNNSYGSIEYKKDGFKINANVDSDANYLINRVALKNYYKVFVNGEQIELKDCGGFVCLDLKTGENQCEITYSDERVFKLFVVGFVFAFIGIAIYLLYVFKLKKFEPKKLGKFLVICYTGLVIGIVLFFYCFPILVSFYSVIRLII